MNLPSFRSQLDECREVLAALAQQAEQAERIAALICETLRDGRTVYTCGNGGSATDAAHLSEELLGRYRTGSQRPPLPCICLNGEVSAITCIANDYGFEQVFARQLKALSHPGDVLVCFSTSGNSSNILEALRTANERGVVSVALLGGNGGEARDLANHALIVPSSNNARVQEAHTLLLHSICEAVETMFG